MKVSARPCNRRHGARGGSGTLTLELGVVDGGVASGSTLAVRVVDEAQAAVRLLELCVLWEEAVSLRGAAVADLGRRTVQVTETSRIS